MEQIKGGANKILAISLPAFTIIFALEKLELLSVDQLHSARFISLLLVAIAIILYVAYGAIKVWGSAEYDFHVHRMKPSQLDFAISLSKKLLPVVPTRREIKAIYQANNSICRLQYMCIRFLGFHIEKYTGFCTILPMTDDAVKLLEKENLHGLKMSPAHIAKQNGSYSCLYVGGVGAIGVRAKKHISIFLSGLIDSEFAKGIRVVYTKPSTKDGLRIAKQFGFVPVMEDVKPDELDRLYVLTKQRYDEKHIHE